MRTKFWHQIVIGFTYAFCTSNCFNKNLIYKSHHILVWWKDLRLDVIEKTCKSLWSFKIKAYFLMHSTLLTSSNPEISLLPTRIQSCQNCSTTQSDSTLILRVLLVKSTRLLSEHATYTLPTAEILSGKNARAGHGSQCFYI